MALHALVTWVVLHHVLCVNAQSASVPTRVSTAAAMPSANSSSWAVPLSGLTDDPSVSWGGILIDVSSGTELAQRYQLVVSDSTSNVSEYQSCEGSPYLAGGTFGSEQGSLTLAPPLNDQHQLILGLNSQFNDTDCSFDFSRSVATVPFGLNLGRDGSWRGSLVLAGAYDANRTDSATWTRLADDTRDTFLHNGTLSLSNVSIATCSSDAGDSCSAPSPSTPATLDFNADAIHLPASIPCNSTFKLAFPSGAITVPANLTAHSARCTSGDDAPLTLGKPFFQAAYVYVDGDGALYVAQAHQYPLGPEARAFDAAATMTPAASPAAAAPTATPTSAAVASFGCASWGVVGFAALCVLHGVV